MPRKKILSTRVLKARINHLLEGGPTIGNKVRYSLLLEGSIDDNETLRACLDQWQQLGLLRILKDPDQCAPDDYCVEMLSFIDEKSPIKGWLNWQ